MKHHAVSGIIHQLASEELDKTNRFNNGHMIKLRCGTLSIIRIQWLLRTCGKRQNNSPAHTHTIWLMILLRTLPLQ